MLQFGNSPEDDLGNKHVHCKPFHTNQNPFFKQTKIFSLEIGFFVLKMTVKID